MRSIRTTGASKNRDYPGQNGSDFPFSVTFCYFLLLSVTFCYFLLIFWRIFLMNFFDDFFFNFIGKNLGALCMMHCLISVWRSTIHCSSLPSRNSLILSPFMPKTCLRTQQVPSNGWGWWRSKMPLQSSIWREPYVPNNGIFLIQ